MKFSVSNKNKNKTGVYKITNLINNKFYVGSTSNSFYKRYHQHKNTYKRGIRDIKILYSAFDKYGIDNFKFEIMHISLREECILVEQFYLDKGTDYNCAKIAGSLLGLKHGPNSKTRTVTGGNHHCAVAIDMYSKKGIFIKSFNSMTDAIKETGIKSKSNITQCCKGKVFSAGGYRWTFKKQNLSKRPNRVGKSICKITKPDIERIGTLQELCEYFKSIGYIKARVSTLYNALVRKNKIYNFKIERLWLSTL